MASCRQLLLAALLTFTLNQRNIMPATPNQIASFVSRARAASRLLVSAKDELTSLADVFTAMGLSTAITAEHLVGEHEGLDLAEFNAAVLALGAINANIKAGSPSNMVKIIKIT